MENNVVFFDGFCNLCNALLHFLMKHDSDKNLLFSWSKSDYAISTLPKNVLEHSETSVIFYRNGNFYKKSEAIFEILKQINSPIKSLSYFSFIPLKYTDYLYDVISKNRYKIFGRKNVCKIPISLDENRFRNNFLSSRNFDQLHI